MMRADLVVLFEHPEWQKPLFAELARRGISYEAFDLKQAAFSNTESPRAKLYFNQASPSAYVRGNTRAVPLALAYMRTLERLGARVLNGADVFALELSKSAQATLLRTLGIDTHGLEAIDVSDDPRDFARMLVTLLTDRVQWQARRSAIADVLRRWKNDVSYRSWSVVIAEALGRRHRGRLASPAEN